MWIRLQLNSLLPSVSFLIGKGGMLYVKLVDLGQLLKKTSPYAYRDGLKPVAVLGKDVLPLEGFNVPPQPLKTHFVPIGLAFKLISAENADLAELLMNRLTKGVARKHGRRQFVASERKAPLLVCVDEGDDACVSVPLWMGDFIKDLLAFRAEVARHQTPEESVASKRKSETTSFEKRIRSAAIGSREDVGEGRLVIDLNPNAESTTNTEMPEPPVPESLPEPVTPAEPPVLSVPEPVTPAEPPVLSVPRPVTPAEPLNDSPTEPRFVMRALLVPKSEPPEEREDVVSPLAETMPAFEPVTSFPGSFVDFAGVTLRSSNRLFPEPGDFVVKFQNTPKRVFFVLGETNAMYAVVDV